MSATWSGRSQLRSSSDHRRAASTSSWCFVRAGATAAARDLTGRDIGGLQWCGRSSDAGSSDRRATFQEVVEVADAEPLDKHAPGV